jgi:hypothetical protein
MIQENLINCNSRYSPHNFKKNNGASTLNDKKKEFQSASAPAATVAQFSIPFTGIETRLELKSTKTARTTIKNWESLWDFPVN